tara:strand:+ start:2960 stop:3592 length:633 start_codon:yes stop_codon:yes gene_type:complete
MPIKLNIPNIFSFISVASPLFITSFFLMDSALQFHMKGVIWLAGQLLSQLFALGLKGTGLPFIKNSLRQYLKDGTPHTVSDFCSVFDDIKYGEYASPSSHGVFHAFTLVYICLGVGFSPSPTPSGITTIIVLSLLAINDAIFRNYNKCETPLDFVVGAIIGAVFGAVYWMLIFFAVPNKQGQKLVYFGKEDNLRQCRMGKQKFKCEYRKI